MRLIVCLVEVSRLLRQAGFSLAMAVFVYLCMAFQFHPRTPIGTQCPTAPLQQVKVAVVCCGAVIGYEIRDPKPGEAGFMQCQCAEKKAGSHAASLPPKLEPYLVSSFEVLARAFLAPIPEPPSCLRSYAGWTEPPPVPPPVPG